MNYALDRIPDDQFLFVEIGTFLGRSISYFVVESINRNKNGKIYAVDTFDGSSEHLDPSNPSYIKELVEDKDYLYNTYKENIKSIDSYITTIRSTSVEASQQFKDNSIDAIYLDAAHDYDSVLTDLNAWYPKMKQDNLIILGDDWTWETVRSAVVDFSKSNNLTVFLPEHNEYIITRS